MTEIAIAVTLCVFFIASGIHASKRERETTIRYEACIKIHMPKECKDE